MPVISDLGLQLYFPLDSLEGNTTPNRCDSSDQVPSGEVKPGVRLVPDEIFGTCMQFDGSANAYIQLPSMNIDYSQGITLEAWVRSDRFGKSARFVDFGIGAGKDNIIFGSNNEGKLRVFVFAGSAAKTVDSDSALPVGRWIHVAATISPKGVGSSQVNLYVNGERVKSGEMYLPNLVQRTSNFIGKSNWTADEYFNGKMAELKVYNCVRSPVEIGLDYDLRNYEPYRSSHPLAFNLYNADGHAVLFIASDPATSRATLTVELRNTSAQTISLLKPAANTPVAPGNYHVQLNFRPGVLSDASITKYQTAQALGDWSAWGQKDPSSGQVRLYLLHTQGKSLTAGEKALLPLSLTAAAAAGARGTQVEMLPNPEQVRYQDGSKVSGSQLVHLQILSHQGLRHIPLHVGIVGSNKVLNDGSPNPLVLEIRNQLRSSDPGDGLLALNPGSPTAPGVSRFILSFYVSDSANEPWALTDGSNGKAIKLSLDKNVPDKMSNDDWTITPPSKDVQAGDLKWTITPNLKTGNLKPGGNFNLYLSGIKTTKPSGLTNLSLRYENLPGYWDGQFVVPIEKTPLLFSNDTKNNVGIGTNNPENRLHVRLPKGPLDFNQAIRIQTNAKEEGDHTSGYGGGMITQNYDVVTAGIFGIREADNWQGALAFYTHTSGSENKFPAQNVTTPTFTEKMRITSDGKVGIGTTSPRTRLDTGTGVLSGAANDYVKAQFTMSGGGTVTWGGAGNRLKWTARFIAISAEKPLTFSTGVVGIDQPKTDIPAAQVHDGANRSANVDGIVLKNWEALYAVHEVGGGGTAITYQIVNSWEKPMNAPSNWFLVAVVNGDDNTVKLGTGLILSAKSSSSKGSPLPAGTILMWSGTLANIPEGWALCDGNNGTPNLADRFILGVGAGTNPGGIGGWPNHTHSIKAPGTQTSSVDGGQGWVAVERGGPATTGHSHSINIPSFSSGAGDHMPPYYKLAFIMKL